MLGSLQSGHGDNITQTHFLFERDLSSVLKVPPNSELCRLTPGSLARLPLRVRLSNSHRTVWALGEFMQNLFLVGVQISDRRLSIYPTSHTIYKPGMHFNLETGFNNP